MIHRDVPFHAGATNTLQPPGAAGQPPAGPATRPKARPTAPKRLPSRFWRWQWVAASILSAFIFTITLFPSHDAFGVLYVLVVVLVADRCTPRRLRIVGGTCVALECTSFAVIHYNAPFDGQYARLALSLIATLVVTILAMRNRQAGDALAAQARLLAHADRITTLGHLTVSIAHEVNQPLSAIATFAQSGGRWLRRDAPDIPEALACLEQIRTSSARAAAIISRVRDLTRKAPVARTRLDLPSLLEDTLLLLRAELAARAIDVRRIVPPHLPAIAGDRIAIQQILMNLLLNAIQALETTTGHRRLISVLLGEDGTKDRTVRIEITDTGPGFSRLDPDHLFEPFVTTKGSGMGMGLAICRNIAAAHGGTIEARNATPRGAIVTVRLPATARAA
ncbi:sensor histidine kinase [Gluconacetobacter takamatsuzukensis]|uniref:histidine kinase n=1 Tax=Gluconacetobacter takamatsuzukensis TaxID=1286190 RepID=A0A7W4KEN0_9PROT|nr:ATP-binding protein [Gluconacetobacter takamatsuzukensis]MBB2205579.1 GHKL domain-containing protein [Gluconacetobacter takamatsuzukensis]